LQPLAIDYRYRPLKFPGSEKASDMNMAIQAKTMAIVNSTEFMACPTQERLTEQESIESFQIFHSLSQHVREARHDAFLPIWYGFGWRGRR